MDLQKVKPRISVIIPVYRNKAGLETTLRSLKNQTIPLTDFEIIVSNDGDHPEIKSFCRHYQVRIINIFPRKGSYNARNEAIRLADGEAIAFVDADIQVPVDWLQRGFDSLLNADYVAGPVNIIPKPNMTIPELYEFSTAFDIKKYMEKYNFGVTANLFVRKEIFNQVGVFDSDLKSSGDLEFGDRVYRSGIFRQVYNGELAVDHPPRDYPELIKKIKRGCSGQVQLKRKYPDRFPFINLHIVYNIFKSLVPPGLKRIRNIQGMHRTVQLFIFSWYIKILKSIFMIKYTLLH